MFYVFSLFMWIGSSAIGFVVFPNEVTKAFALSLGIGWIAFSVIGTITRGFEKVVSAIKNKS